MISTKFGAIRSTILATISAAAAVAGAPAALAGDGIFDGEKAEGRLYLSGYGGATFGRDAQFTGLLDPEAGVPGTAGDPAAVDLDFDTARTFGGAVGAQLPVRFFGFAQPRLELEGGHFRQNIGGGSFNGGDQFFVGEIEGTTIYLNNYTDIRLRDGQKLVPYLGGGLGVAFIDSNVGYFPATATAPTFGIVDEDTAFTTHAAAGMTYSISGNLEAYTEGRYTRYYDVDLERRFLAGGADGFSAELEDTLDNFSVLGGIRYKF